ncbi:MAG TPA: hypothetical protein VE650_05140, partial [Acetobacteraceae bacterium]|nr:hypothetical protein [Acetobacteraceae bacterium]
RYATTRLPFGMNGPAQRAKLAIARRMYLGAPAPATRAPVPDGAKSVLESILDLSRWAPSGDNAQPWRFEILGDDAVAVHPQVEAGNPYEYRDGEPTLLSLGMLLETMRIAASTHSRDMQWTAESDPQLRRIVVRFQASPGLEPDPLAGYVPLRSVERRAYASRRLTASEKSALENSLGGGLRVRWFETAGEKWRIARLSARATDIRLRAPEMFAVHQRIIDWKNRYSRTGVPAQAIGLDAATLRLMRWAMADWGRADRLNRILGTGAAAAQLDLVPGMRSSGFFAIGPASADWSRSAESLLQAGQALQRFWLTATKLGLAIQPSLAVLLFAHYGEVGASFTQDERLRTKAGALAAAFGSAFGQKADQILFLGRIGQAASGGAKARSIRRPLAELMAGTGNDPEPAQGLS